MYALNFVFVGSGVWGEYLHRQQPWDPIVGAAFSFWAALAVLCAVGIRYPLAMIPILLMQLLYKTLWIFGVYLPLRAAGRSSDLAQGFLLAIAFDLIVIPWPYVVQRYVRKPGDRWRSIAQGAAQ